MDTEKNLPVIYGITEHETRNGLQGYAIDGQTGEVLESHYCSSEGFAKNDLGFSKIPMEASAYFHKKVHETYSKKYPEGYRMEWIGFWKSNSKIIELVERTKPDFDGNRPKITITD